jgi:Domain of unknown function (DUF4350)
MRRDVIVAVVAVAAIALVSLLTARAPQGPKWATHASDDFSFGGYRAWYDLMAREGVHVTRFHNHHDALPAGIDTLILSFPQDGLGSFWDRSERDALQGWVRAGGRLIDIGITPSVGRAEDTKGESVLGVDRPVERGPLAGPWASTVSSLPERGKLRLVPQPHHNVDVLLRDRSGPLVVRYTLGRGEVISIAPAAVFENRMLARGDDARLAYLAARPGRPGGTVAFDETIRGDLTEKAWYLALNVPELVALAFLLLAGLLWLAYGLFPLGPPLRLRAPREPTSREFLDAVAALYGRVRAREHARDALTAEAHRNVERLPRTATNLALAVRISGAAADPVPDDATLVAVAALARTAREETIRAGRNAAITPRRTPSGRAGAGRRRS